MKVLFIAYYFEPFEGVGAKRISYWAKNILRVSNNAISCDVVTAIKQTNQSCDTIDNIFYVKNTETPTLLSKIFKVDVGATWLNNLKIFFNENEDRWNYDAVIITGGPFLHFFIANEFRKRGIKVILDFRDPFVSNHRRVRHGLFSKIKKILTKIIESYFIYLADKVITVNKQCAELLGIPTLRKNKLYIIDNGYDETVIKHIQYLEKHKSYDLNLCYTGTIYYSIDLIEKLLEMETHVTFYHIGKKNKYSLNHPKYIEHGEQPYSQCISTLSGYDVAVLFTYHELESTTKVFDYIALKMPILVICTYELYTGALFEILKNYPKVYWANNDLNFLRHTVNTIRNDLNTNIDDFDTSIFSREAGLKNLISILRGDQ